MQTIEGNGNGNRLGQLRPELGRRVLGFLGGKDGNKSSLAPLLLGKPAEIALSETPALVSAPDQEEIKQTKEIQLRALADGIVKKCVAEATANNPITLNKILLLYLNPVAVVPNEPLIKALAESWNDFVPQRIADLLDEVIQVASRSYFEAPNDVQISENNQVWSIIRTPQGKSKYTYEIAFYRKPEVSKPVAVQAPLPAETPELLN